MEESVSGEGLSKREPQRWVPSPELRRWLLIGACAVVVEACLSAASLSIELSRHEESEGYTISDALDLATILPGILVLLTFLALAREAASVGLWRSSIGVFGSAWLMVGLVYTGTEVVSGKWEILLTLAVGIGMVCLFVIIANRPSGFLQPASAESPPKPSEAEPSEPNAPNAKQRESERPRSEGGGWGWLGTLGTLVFARLLITLVRHLHFDWYVSLSMIVGAVSAGSLLVFLIWFAICKIRLRDKLGVMAAVSGWADLLGAALGLGLAVYWFWVCIQVVVNAQEFPDFYEPKILMPAMAVSGFWIVCDLLVAALFLSVRARFKPDWPAELRP